MTDRVSDVLLGSCSKGTMKQYKCYLKKFNEYCTKKELVLERVTVNDGLDFLAELSENGLGYSAINSARSALSFVLPTYDKYSFGEHPLTVRLLKGIFRKTPPKPRYESVWDPSVVLNKLESWPDNAMLELRQLAMKTVCLFALCSAQRCQTLSIIKLVDVNISETGTVITVSELVKTSAPGRKQPVITFPRLQGNKLCVTSTIEAYIQKSNKFRDSKNNNLFISHVKPYKNVTSQTIARWLKCILKEAGIYTNVYLAHSFRHSSVSKASAMGCNVDLILQKASWTKNSAMFAKHYNRPIADMNDEFVNSLYARNVNKPV